VLNCRMSGGVGRDARRQLASVGCKADFSNQVTDAPRADRPVLGSHGHDDSMRYLYISWRYLMTLYPLQTVKPQLSRRAAAFGVRASALGASAFRVPADRPPSDADQACLTYSTVSARVPHSLPCESHVSPICGQPDPNSHGDLDGH
jgi:hypothetical protein